VIVNVAVNDVSCVERVFVIAMQHAVKTNSSVKTQAAVYHLLGPVTVLILVETFLMN